MRQIRNAAYSVLHTSISQYRNSLKFRFQRAGWLMLHATATNATSVSNGYTHNKTVGVFCTYSVINDS